jgi:DNA-binding transcriptional MerR regulator
MRFDKKDRELIAKILSYLKKLGIEIEEAFSYLSRHSTREEVRKQDFVLLLQTLELKCDLAAINSLFTHLEDGRRGVVTRSKW